MEIHPLTAALWGRIKESLAAAKLSERRACLDAGLGVDAIRTIKRGHPPSRETLRALARVLRRDLDYFEEVAPDVRLNARADPSRDELVRLYDSVPRQKRNDFLAGARALVRLALDSQSDESAPASRRAKGGPR